MNLKEAIELIDPEIEKELKGCAINFFGETDEYNCGTEYPELCDKCQGRLQGRLSQMKREVEFLVEQVDCSCHPYGAVECKRCIRIEAVNILINHLKEVLK